MLPGWVIHSQNGWNKKKNISSEFAFRCDIDSTHHFFRNACTKSGSLRFSQFSGCWLILSVYILMSFDFPFVRLFGVQLPSDEEYDIVFVVFHACIIKEPHKLFTASDLVIHGIRKVVSRVFCWPEYVFLLRIRKY